MKKYLAEMFGTMVLVLMGCGVAVSLGCSNEVPSTVIGTALAFGLSVVAMAYLRCISFWSHEWKGCSWLYDFPSDWSVHRFRTFVCFDL